MRKITILTTWLCASAFLSPAAVIGSFGIAGVGPAQVNGSEIDFFRTFGAADGVTPANPNDNLFEPQIGRFLVSSVEAGSDFASIPLDVNGEIRGSTRDMMFMGGGAIIPGIPTLLTAFLTFDNSPMRFDLTLLETGVGNPAECGSFALGGQCTPGDIDPGPGVVASPFTLTNESFGVSGTLSVLGLMYADALDTDPTPYRGVYSFQIVSIPGLGGIPRIPNVLASAAAGGVRGTYSADFAPAEAIIPEPSTALLGLAGAALVLIGRFARR